ncbi:hypothetical protein PsorP6_006410 [Peronosclerospora sorghi]|uniref:Uncharacterized protein n=1 Tax=Peronosclerospora sorghi TaxID=230839 RepID=A0ACC0W291_9STRA|nr:hypothetical protein PsorP6_006410 [Peronosclerospora sorghi]
MGFLGSGNKGIALLSFAASHHNGCFDAFIMVRASDGEGESFVPSIQVQSTLSIFQSLVPFGQ